MISIAPGDEAERRRIAPTLNEGSLYNIDSLPGKKCNARDRLERDG